MYVLRRERAGTDHCPVCDDLVETEWIQVEPHPVLGVRADVTQCSQCGFEFVVTRTFVTA